MEDAGVGVDIVLIQEDAEGKHESHRLANAALTSSSFKGGEAVVIRILSCALLNA